MRFQKTHLTLAELGRVFGVSEKMICRWLVDVGLRSSKGKPTFTAFSEKMVTSAHPQNLTDKYVWHSERVVAALVENGSKPVVPPPMDLVRTAYLKGPFTIRTHTNSTHEIVGVNGEVTVWVSGDLNARIVCLLLNVGQRLGVIDRLQPKQIPESASPKELVPTETDGFVICEAR